MNFKKYPLRKRLKHEYDKIELLMKTTGYRPEFEFRFGIVTNLVIATLRIRTYSRYIFLIKTIRFRYAICRGLQSVPVWIYFLRLKALSIYIKIKSKLRRLFEKENNVKKEVMDEKEERKESRALRVLRFIVGEIEDKVKAEKENSGNVELSAVERLEASTIVQTLLKIEISILESVASQGLEL